MKIGILGGAFNPVHNGHINLADNYFSDLHLDKIIFIPTSVPPHKTSQNLASAQDRINMLKLALCDRKNYEVSTIEFERAGKSYTYDTLQELKLIYPDGEFFLILGADQFMTFHYWYKFKEILATVTICTSARENEQEKKKMLDYAKTLDELDGRYYISDKPVLNLSSSDVRQMIKDGLDISSLVPAKVCDYISEKRLYCV